MNKNELENRIKGLELELNNLKTDIITGKQAEINSVASNLFNSQIINSVQEGIIVIDRNLIYQVWNPFMEGLSDITASMVLGKHTSELFPFLEEAGVIVKVKKALICEPTDTIELLFHLPETGKTGWTSYSLKSHNLKI